MDKVKITADSGEIVEAIAPVIISASRSTDIPAFYAKWFFYRLSRGYCVWYNPFNRRKVYVSFKNTRVIVFWTKNPKPVIPYLHILDEMGIHYYFQVTLNDYEDEGFEPCVPALKSRIETFRELSSLIGKERVIWRFDPLIITPELGVRQLLTKIWHVGNALRGYTEKLVFSFIDVSGYRKVQNNLVRETGLFTKDSVCQAELTSAEIEETCAGLVKIREAWAAKGWDVTMATCAETADLSEFGIEHNCCIDADLMERLFGDDRELVYFLHTGKLPEPDRRPAAASSARTSACTTPAGISASTAMQTRAKSSWTATSTGTPGRRKALSTDGAMEQTGAWHLLPGRVKENDRTSEKTEADFKA